MPVDHREHDTQEERTASEAWEAIQAVHAGMGSAEERALDAVAKARAAVEDDTVESAAAAVVAAAVLVEQVERLGTALARTVTLAKTAEAAVLLRLRDAVS